jgi:citrate synthase
MSDTTDEKPIYAKGLKGVIANESSLSDVRGEEGRLLYLGYDIEDLVELCHFEEIIYLLLNKRLPNQKELDQICRRLRSDRELPQPILDFFKTATKSARPMSALRTAVSMLGMYDDRTKDPSQMKEIGMSLIAKIPVMVAYYYRVCQGLDLPPVREDLGEAAHFLWLLKGEEPDPDEARTLDVAYILHADHGMNASTFAARVCISTLTDMYSAITSAIGTLKGPLHGGANEGVIEMLKEIGDESNVESYIAEKLRNKEKIMGMGHRVYRTLDPRAPHLRRMAIRLTEKLGEPKWIRMSERIAKIVRTEKGLNANVDFYSATVYYSIGIPTKLFTAVFAIARVAGWVAQVLEQLEDNSIYRPLTAYVGPHTPIPVPTIDMR